MCVICVSDKNRPTDEQVEQMFAANGSGAGIAWRDIDEESGETRVYWEKGLALDRIQELCRTVPMPFVAHFRIPSCGAAIQALCHPFPIHQQVPLDLYGNTKGFVLFHNGHWHEWKTTAKELAIKHGIKIPTGAWSDSRAMAWAAANYGLGILEFIDEKVVAFGADDWDVWGAGWTRTAEDAGELLVSNKIWEHRFVRRGNNVITYPRPDYDARSDYYRALPEHYKRDGVVGSNDADKKPQRLLTPGASGGDSRQENPFRNVQQGQGCVQGGGDEQKGVQASEAEVRADASGGGGRVHSEGEDESTNDRALVSLAKARQELIDWARSRNPSPYKIPRVVCRGTDSEDLQRRQWQLQARQGISRLGPM